ncbi:apolipoprotein C-I-like [Equus przewalskii]|uniref:Apolipoprotein C-I-like n=1 Tax=Equus przewalskii TaxID=9798 RepID=A0ABM4QHW4_EQUPR|nr:PREDICTED: apolipoprotein C-I-like [Equus przewalskii]
MRLALSLPVLLVALWMVCEGRAPAQADLEPDQADLEPDGVIDVIWGGLKKVGKHLGKEIVKHIIHDINKKNGASATRKMASNTMKDIPDTVDHVPPPHKDAAPLNPQP